MDGLMNTAQAAKYLGYATNTLKKSRYTGKLSEFDTPKHFKFGHKTIRYKKSDLDEWIENANQG